MKLDNCIEKTCCLYASDWHLAVMLLPFISDKLKENNKIFMKFQDSIEDKIEQLLGKLELKNKSDIEKISWSNEIREEEYTDKDKIYIVSGSDEYIENMNSKIEQFYANMKEKVQIIDCFHVTENRFQNGYVEKIDFNKMLTTRGEQKI